MKFVSYNIQYGFGADSRYDLARFGMENRNEVFVATEEPHGLIKATLSR